MDIDRVVNHRYPVIFLYQKYAAELNHHLPQKERIVFQINHKISPSLNYVTKIGIRAYNPICSLPTLEKHEFSPDAYYREQYLDERFGKGNWEEYDVHASVPRVAHASAFPGGMGDMEEDIYKTIFLPFTDDYIRYFDSSKNHWDNDMRKFYKLMFMRLYFGGS